MSDIKKMYNPDDVMEIIKNQLVELMQEDYEYYKNYNFKLANEQYYIDPEERKEPGLIFIVIKFLPADINYNQNVVPFTITAVSEHNGLEVCQKLLLEYAQTYNLIDDITEKDVTYNQTYTTPQVMSNFSEVYYGYRNTFFMSGTFLLSYNTNPSKLYYVLSETEKYPVNNITFSEDFVVQTDTQPFFNTNNFVKSIGKYGTHTINFAMYLINDSEEGNLCNKILEIIKGEKTNGVNETFKFEIVYNSGISYQKDFKLVSFSKSQNVGELPVISCTFTI